MKRLIPILSSLVLAGCGISRTVSVPDLELIVCPDPLPALPCLQQDDSELPDLESRGGEIWDWDLIGLYDLAKLRRAECKDDLAEVVRLVQECKRKAGEIR